MDYQVENRLLQDELFDIERRIGVLRNEIDKLQKEKQQKMQSNCVIEEEPEEIIQEENQDNQNLKKLLLSYRSLPNNFTENDLIMILPSKKNQMYQEILLRLAFESYKEIKETANLEKMVTSLEEKEIVQEVIDYEQRKIGYIKNYLMMKEEVLDNPIQNNIVLVPTLNNKIRIIDELEHIPPEFYGRFLELVNSIIDGTFKNVKTFKSNENLLGISEVKGFQVRIIFTRIGYNTYALISAFVKKTDTDKYYLESLSNKISDYHQIEDRLKKNLTNPDFLRYNEENVNLMFDILTSKIKKGGEVI